MCLFPESLYSVVILVLGPWQYRRQIHNFNRYQIFLLAKDKTIMCSHLLQNKPENVLVSNHLSDIHVVCFFDCLLVWLYVLKAEKFLSVTYKTWGS